MDFRYVEQAKIESPGFSIYHVKGNIENWLPQIVRDERIARLGVEAKHISICLYQSIVQASQKAGIDVQFIPVKGIIESLRVIKDEAEIDSIIKACAMADEAINYASQHLHYGITEKQFAWEVESFIRQNGSQTLPFEIIVASGPNAALPHAQPTDRLICEGEMVTIDLGARYNGYCSDITRTFYLGKMDTKFNEIYNIVLAAQLAGLSIIEGGMKAIAADELIRGMIRDSGYGDMFGHGLGHGIGIETHELPSLGTQSEDCLLNNMTFTVEPGIYIPGWGGVRIEDTVVIKDEKLVCLTHSSKGAVI